MEVYDLENWKNKWLVEKMSFALIELILKMNFASDRFSEDGIQQLLHGYNL